MNIIAVDDEQYALLDLQSAIEEALPDNPLSCFNSSKAALNYAKSNMVDLAFIDIEMGGMNGLELAKCLKNTNRKTAIVFVTGYSQYAVDAFTLHVGGYIMKPVTAKAVREVIEYLRNPVILEIAGKNTEEITVKFQGSTQHIPFRDISHIEVTGHIVNIRLINGREIGVYSGFWDIAAELLKDQRFIQCHRSFLVNQSDVETIEGSEIIMRGGARIPISRSFSGVKDTIIKWLISGNGE